MTRTSRFGAATRAALGAMLALGATLALAGCSMFESRPLVVVPIQKDAAAQYACANHYRERQQIELIADATRYAKARDEVMQTYQKVIDYFPNDREYGPLAELDIVSMRCGFDSRRAVMTGRQFKKTMRQALDDLQALMKRCPAYDYVQVKGLYFSGRCHLLLKDYRAAQGDFRQARDRFIKNDNTKVKALAEVAAAYYKQVYVEE
jgi:tetratricopeptide (TPR) repeat protein